jgi:hypothetical protein
VGAEGRCGQRSQSIDNVEDAHLLHCIVVIDGIVMLSHVIVGNGFGMQFVIQVFVIVEVVCVVRCCRCWYVDGADGIINFNFIYADRFLQLWVKARNIVSGGGIKRKRYVQKIRSLHSKDTLLCSSILC